MTVLGNYCELSQQGLGPSSDVDKTTPIILTTRDHSPDKIARMGTGAADFLPKPFVIEELLARIRAAFSSLETSGSGDR